MVNGIDQRFKDGNKCGVFIAGVQKPHKPTLTPCRRTSPSEFEAMLMRMELRRFYHGRPSMPGRMFTTTPGKHQVKFAFN